MEPVLREGDCLVVHWGGRARPGDLVVVALPGRPLGVKRAVLPVGKRWWVEGDNRSASTDSRHLGPVPVLARVVGRYWPWDRRCRRPARRAGGSG